MKKSQKKIMLFVTAGLFVLTGTYNALVINADSHISSSDTRFLKRLDEVYGVVKEGRQIAGHKSWEKLSAPRLVVKSEVVEAPSKSLDSATPVATEEAPEAGVKEDLSLSLVEVIHPTKWSNGLKTAQFSGAITTRDGIIEELEVSLPGGLGLSASFTEMSGNIFEYELNGEIQSGLMYQVNQNAYMVTLTTGPLEGARLRFSSEAPAEEQAKTQELLAENNIEVGSFGNSSAPQEVQNDEPVQHKALQAQSFNLDQAPTL